MSSETNMKLPEEKLEHLCSYKLHNMEMETASHICGTCPSLHSKLSSEKLMSNFHQRSLGTFEVLASLYGVSSGKSFICKGKAAYNIPPPYLYIVKSLRTMGYEVFYLGGTIFLLGLSVVSLLVLHSLSWKLEEYTADVTFSSASHSDTQVSKPSIFIIHLLVGCIRDQLRTPDY
ncbi:hypothetical protein JHK86_006714 [Glycine max]|nr:hypothetical protein JHK86_006714 [Glycine max]